jgi:hypothetical protein
MAERVLSDPVLLWRILWASHALCIQDLCAASCVRRAWRDAVLDDAEWQPLLRAALPIDAALESDLTHRGRGAFKRALMQLYRSGAASLPPRFGLRDYTLLMDASDETGATVARATIPLSALQTSRDYAWLHARSGQLPDGGAAAARFLERLAQGESDTRELSLRLLLRRADGAVSVLSNAQGGCRFEDQEDADDPHFDNFVMHGFFEHCIWEALENANTRAGAVTWHSGPPQDRSKPPPMPRPTRLFERPVHVYIPARNITLPGRWTWRLQFPAAGGAVTQLDEMTLRVGIRVLETVHEPVSYRSVRVAQTALLEMLEQRDFETDAL